MRAWEEHYRARTMTAPEAVQGVRRGARVFIGSGCAEPVLLVGALAARADLEDVEVLHILTVGHAPYAEAEQAGRFRTNAFFIGSNVRAAVERGAADYPPIFLSAIPALFRSRRLRLDVALIAASPPDRHGYLSLGVSVDVVKAAVESADVVLAEVNPAMPRTHGAGFVHASDLDGFVASTEPILEHASPPPTEATGRIGRFCASLIDDGATLQLGIGAIPNAVLANLGSAHDLGLHTEMCSDGILPLLRNGVVNGRRKSLHARKAVTSFCMGTRALYDFVDDNPGFEFLPTEYVNDPDVIARNERMVSINSALQLDLTGQVCADSIGERFYSGIGGQVDFIRGAARAVGGRSIIALESTAKGGAISRIVPTLATGAGVVTTRGDVHTVVTEFGIAELAGRTVRERALSLISIAHPDFRGELLAAAKRRHLVAVDQEPWPEHGRPYPVELEARARHGNQDVFFRPLRPADERLVRAFLYALPPEVPEDGPRAPPTPQEVQDLCALDYDGELAIAGLVADGEGQRIVAIGRYVLARARGLAELSIAVAASAQNEGIGTRLFETLCRAARDRKVAGFTGTVHAANHRMMGIFHKSGEPVESRLEGGRYHVVVRFGAG